MGSFQGILKHTLFFSIPAKALFFSVTPVFSVASAFPG
jgi:hypothetical protein